MKKIRLAGILVGCLMVEIIAQAEAADKNTVLLLHMDESGWNGTANEVKDSSSYGNHGVANGGITTADGKINRAGVFDGKDDYLDCGSFNTAGDSNKQTTIEFWFKGETGGTYLITRYDTAGTGRSFHIGVSSASFGIVISDNGTLNAGHYKFYKDETDYTDNLWRHFAVTFNGNLSDDSADNKRLKMYVNGTRIDDAALTKTQDGAITTIWNSGSDVLLGARKVAGVVSDYAEGAIDEVRIYNRALSAEEIQQHYKKPGSSQIVSASQEIGKVSNKVSDEHEEKKIETMKNPTWDNVARTATFVVAANDSVTISKKQADYVCDGTDDQAEIQAAIDALPRSGGHIRLTEGRFNITDTIVINKPLKLTGAGYGGNPGKQSLTILMLVRGSECSILEYSGSGDIRHGLLEDMCLMGHSAGRVGHIIDIKTKLRDATFSRLGIWHAAQDGIHIESSITSWWISITDCQIEFNKRASVWIGGSGNFTDLHVTNTWLAGSQYGIWVDGTSADFKRYNFSNVGFYRISNTGMYLRNCDSFTVTGCYFLGKPGGTAIYLTANGTKQNYGHIITSNWFKNWKNTLTTHTVGTNFDIENIIFTNNRITNCTNYISNLSHTRFVNSRIYDKHIGYFQSIIAASTDYVHTAITGTGAKQRITTAITNPDVPRNISITTTNNASPSGNVTITGIDAKGNSTTEDIAISVGGTAFGNKAFGSVSKITIPAGVSADDIVTVGISDKLGLSNIVYASGDVYKVKKNNADSTIGTVNTTYDTVDCATITGNDDFTIYYKSNLNIIK